MSKPISTTPWRAPVRQGVFHCLRYLLSLDADFYVLLTQAHLDLERGAKAVFVAAEEFPTKLGRDPCLLKLLPTLRNTRIL